MTDTINQRHWGARLKGGHKPCSSCGNDAVSYFVTVDENDVATRIEWFCDVHQPESPEAL